MRINTYIAKQLGISRREADRAIEAAEVQVNKKSAQLGQQIDPQKDKVFVQGKEIAATEQEKITIALYKPKGYMTTRSDPKNRKTVMSLLPKELKSLKPAGRLDFESEGLLLLSNDGNVIYKSTHPKYEKQKEYRMVFTKSITKELIHRFERGIHLTEGMTRADKVTQIENNEMSVVIHQGWNRQLRRMAEKCQYDIVKLVRIRIGDILLEDLKPGEWRKII